MSGIHKCGLTMLLLAAFASARSPTELFDNQWQAGPEEQDTFLEPVGVFSPAEPHTKHDQRGRALWSKATAPFRHRGGHVMTGNVAVTMIYLGYKESDPVPAWLNWWAYYVGSTDWYRTIRWYHSADNVTNVKTYTTGNINLARSWYYDSTFTMVNKVNMSGTEFQMVWGVISKAITLQGVTPTVDDLYVLVSADGTIPRSRNCSVRRSGGWHSAIRRTPTGTASPFFIKLAWIPQDPCWSYARTDPNTGTVVPNTGFAPYGYDPAMSPSGYPSIDSMAPVLAHEVLEAVTDPGFSMSPAWFGANVSLEEAADVCSGYYRYPLLQTNTAQGLQVQYTEMVNGLPFIFPLTYLPVVSNATGADYGCVFGVDASLTVQVSNSDNTLYVYYNFGAPTPPPVVDYDVVDYYSGRDRAPEPDSSVIVKPTV